MFTGVHEFLSYFITPLGNKFTLECIKFTLFFTLLLLSSCYSTLNTLHLIFKILKK